MRQQELEDWLVVTLDDFKLSQSEALELRDILPRLKPDDIAFVRNKSFMLAREPARIGGDNAVASLLWLEKISKVIDISVKPNQSPLPKRILAPVKIVAVNCWIY